MKILNVNVNMKILNVNMKILNVNVEDIQR